MESFYATKLIKTTDTRNTDGVLQFNEKAVQLLKTKQKTSGD